MKTATGSELRLPRARSNIASCLLRGRWSWAGLQFRLGHARWRLEDEVLSGTWTEKSQLDSSAMKMDHWTVVPEPTSLANALLIAERCFVNTKVVPLESDRRTTDGDQQIRKLKIGIGGSDPRIVPLRELAKKDVGVDIARQFQPLWATREIVGKDDLTGGSR